MQIEAKTTGYRCGTAADIVLADIFFYFFIMRSWFSYNDSWADKELSSLWIFWKG